MDEFNQANMERWNKLAKSHYGSEYYGVKEFLEGKSSLFPIEEKELPDISGKSLLHLQCHFGMDTLSLARKGADVTGVDYSEDAIDLAEKLSEESGIQGEFICSDIYKLQEKLDKQFDIVYTSYGVLCWLPDIVKWAEVVSKFLKPGGIFYIVDGHPFNQIFNNEDDQTKLSVEYPYFTYEVMKFEVEGSYAQIKSDGKYTSYEWFHSLSSIVNSLIKAGLNIEFLNEHKDATWRVFPFMIEKEDGMWEIEKPLNLPLTFSILAKKPIH